MTNLLQSKAKNILAIVFSSIYAFMVFLNFNFNFTLYGSWRNTINAIFTNVASLILPVAVIVFIALRNKDFSFKKWLLPITFGLMLIKSTYTLFMSFANTFSVFNGDIEPLHLISLLFPCLSFAAMIIMFIGTLGNFKLVALLKYGALSYSVLVLLFLVFDFIAAGGFQYFEAISEFSLPVTFLINYARTLIVFIAQILFYIGLFILFPTKKILCEKEQ